MYYRSNKELLVNKMAQDLIRHNALVSERDAIRALTSCGYRLGDVAVLALEALTEARRKVIADNDALGQILTVKSR